MALSDVVNTFGQMLLKRHGERVHKLALHHGFTCPNMDGTKGIGGCTFCNNSSFSPNVVRGGQHAEIISQINAGKKVIAKRTGAKKFLAYFQSYTNTYADVDELDKLYRTALAEENVIGLAIGTRPDCVPEPVLDLLAGYRDEGYEVFLELGLQSAFDETLEIVNRGHTFSEYQTAVAAVHARELDLCTHIIAGLPGEDYSHCKTTLEKTLELGVNGLKIHPLHVVKGTKLANSWRAGEYQPLEMEQYVNLVADLVIMTPPDITFHRLTGTASTEILLTPAWCSKKWLVLNSIEKKIKEKQKEKQWN